MAVDVERLKSVSFPMRKGPRGYFAEALGFDSIEEAIEQVLGTIPGERVMRPSFGCDIHKRLFQPNDEAGAAIAKNDIATAISAWAREAGIALRIVDIEVTIDSHSVTYSVRYQVANGPVQTADGDVTLRNGR
jgi:phage baseplate assembly protein W